MRHIVAFGTVEKMVLFAQGKGEDMVICSGLGVDPKGGPAANADTPLGGHAWVKMEQSAAASRFGQCTCWKL